MVEVAASWSRRVARCIAIAVFALAPAACMRDLPVPELVKQAKEQQAKGDWPSSIVNLKNALLKQPENAEARYLLGVAYNETGDALSAEKELRFARKLGLIEGGHVDAELGRALVAAGKFQETLDEIKPLPGFDARAVAGVHAARGHANLGLGKPAEAAKAFEEALASQPDYPYAQIGQAQLALMQGKRDAGIALLDQILKQSPKYFDAWLMKGDLSRIDGKFDEAVAAYGSAIEIRPASVLARISRASSYVAAGKLTEAQADVDAARKIAPRAAVVAYTQAFIYFRQSKLREAQTAIQQALQLAPRHLSSLLLAAAINYSLGSYNQAESQLNMILLSAPGNVLARKLLAATLLELNRAKDALEVVRPLASARNATPDWLVLALAGSASLRAGDADTAASLFEKAVSAEPGNARLRSELGMSYLAKGDLERASSTLEEATELDSTLGAANSALIVTYLRGREYDKALEALARFEQKNPKAPLIHQLRGIVYAAKGDAAAARESYGKALSVQPSYFPAAASLALGHVKEGDLAGAQRVYEDFLDKNKDSLPALMALAKLQAVGGKHQAALELLERARRAHPNAVAPRIELATYYLKTGRAQQASVIAAEASNVAPADPAVIEVMGSVQLATGQAASAAVSFATLAHQRPGSIVAQTGQGFANMRLRKYKEAAEFFRQALKLAPERYEIMVALTEALRSGKSYDEALRSAQNLQKLYPEIPAGLMLEGDIRYDQGKFADALKQYESALKLSKTGDLMVRAYQAQARAGDPKGAVARLEGWVKENPGDAVARERLGEAMLIAGNNKAAAEHYLWLVERAPENGLALNNLAVSLQRLNDTRAFEFAERALKVAPADPLVMDTYGWILVSRGRAKEAVPFLEKSVAQLPGAPEVRYHLGVALAKAGEQGRAKRELERALAEGKPFPGMNEAKSLLSQL